MNSDFQADLWNCSDSSLVKIGKSVLLKSNPAESPADFRKRIYRRYCLMKKHKNYTYIRQLGSDGKDGRTFLVRNSRKVEYAMKIFREDKRRSSIDREIRLQIRAAGISPRVVDADLEGRFFVMEKLDENLYDLFRVQGGQLTDAQQSGVLGLFRRLDELGVFHKDPNPLNFMMKDGRFYVIDFGFAREMTARTAKRYGPIPNQLYMTLGLKVQLQSLNPKADFRVLDRFLENLKPSEGVRK